MKVVIVKEIDVKAGWGFTWRRFAWCKSWAGCNGIIETPRIASR